MIWIIIFILFFGVIVFCAYFLLSRHNDGSLKSEIEKAIIDSGLFKAEASKWILEIILSNLDKGSKVIDLAVRTDGELLSLEEKRQHGIRANAKVSNQYLLSLTAEGKKDPIRAAITVVRRILHKRSLQKQKEDILRTEKLGTEMESEFMCARDDRTCKSALALDGKRFAKDEAPDLPLPDCDAEYCRCLFLYHVKGRK
jgi:hypothetical protein